MLHAGVSSLREYAKDFQYGVFPFPFPLNGRQRTSLRGFAFVANAKGKNPEEAAKFCVWELGDHLFPVDITQDLPYRLRHLLDAPALGTPFVVDVCFCFGAILVRS
jgi:hypothetical protein